MQAELSLVHILPRGYVSNFHVSALEPLLTINTNSALNINIIETININSNYVIFASASTTHSIIGIIIVINRTRLHATFQIYFHNNFASNWFWFRLISRSITSSLTFIISKVIFELVESRAIDSYSNRLSLAKNSRMLRKITVTPGTGSIDFDSTGWENRSVKVLLTLSWQSATFLFDAKESSVVRENIDLTAQFTTSRFAITANSN